MMTTVVPAIQEQQQVKTYSIYDSHNRKVSYPLLQRKDITTGILLGRGTFSHVREVKDICQESLTQRILNEVERTADSFLRRLSNSSNSSSSSSSSSASKSSIYTNGEEDDSSSLTSSDSDSITKSAKNRNEYAIKEMRDDLSFEDRLCARFDLETEALFLTNLSHQNIIKMHGLGVSSRAGLFLLLERIDLTLKEQCLIWKKKHKTTKSFFLKRTSQLMLTGSVNRKKRASAWNERLNVAIDLANTMTYLHKMNIIYRDLKPENIGFDKDGNLKLFDFGLATRLTSDLKVTADQYKLTQNTGTRRYMAPEVYRGAYYGKPADVYSFAILLWELMTLKSAFKGETRESHAQKVYGYWHHRPQVPFFWPHIFQQLVRESWSADAANRPTFQQVSLCLNHSQI